MSFSAQKESRQSLYGAIGWETNPTKATVVPDLPKFTAYKIEIGSIPEWGKRWADSTFHSLRGFHLEGSLNERPYTLK
jgi:hypothetical protein